MRIAVLGTGNVGGILGRRLAQCGHEVCFGTRNVDDPRVQALLQNAACTAADSITATRFAELVVLAVPWGSALAMAEALKDDLIGKILVDCSNPLNTTFTGLEMGYTTSAAEMIAARAPGAHVIKAFNMVSAATMANPLFGSIRANLFYCGDNEPAKSAVHGLADQLGFSPVDTGPLVNARLLEPVAMLYIYLAFHGWGSNCALQIIKR